MKRALLIGLVTLLLSLAIPLSYGGFGVLAQLPEVAHWLIPTTLGMVMLGWIFNAARLRLLVSGVESSLRRRQALATVISTEFAGAASPAGVGGPLTYVYLLRQHHVKTGHAAALYAVDHIMDLAFFATALPLALAVFTFDRQLDHPVWLLGLLLGLLAAGLGFMWLLLRRYRTVLRLFGRLLRRLHVSIARRRRLARWVIQFRHAVKLLLGMPWHRLVLLYVYCMSHWLLRYSILPVVLYGLHHPVPWSYLFVVQGMLLFVGQLSFLPGGTGSVELGFSALLAAWLSTDTLALALILWRFATFYWYLLAGAPVFAATAGAATGRLLIARRERESAG